MCGISGRMEAAHVVGRRHRTTRWGIDIDIILDINDRNHLIHTDNYDLCGHCLCHSCHQHYDEHGPLESAIVDKVIGAKRKEILQFLAKNSVTQYQEYEVIKATLSSLLPPGLG